MAKRSKFNVDLSNKDQRTYNGIVFDSAGEMKMYRDCLIPQLEAGKIKSIERQVDFELQEGFEHDGAKILPIMYCADFVVTFSCGRKIVFDFKGMPTADAKLKRKMFWKKYPELPFYWVVYSKMDGGYVPFEFVQKQRKKRAQARLLMEDINNA